jgi:hypothetical protein
MLQNGSSVSSLWHEDWIIRQPTHLIFSRKNTNQQSTHLTRRFYGVLCSPSLLLAPDLSQEHLDRVLTLCDTHSIPATQFEITFILSCLQYEAKQCDAVVLEVYSHPSIPIPLCLSLQVGCGGEWDATNVIRSSLSIICSVGLKPYPLLPLSSPPQDWTT